MVARTLLVATALLAATTALAQGWRPARQGEVANVSVAQASYVWIERLRQPSAPMTVFNVTGPQGNSWQFEHGVLAAGDYAFAPAAAFDSASSWRVRASSVVDGARAGATRESAMPLSLNQPVRLLPGVNPSWVVLSVPKAGRAVVFMLSGSVSQDPQWINAEGKSLAKGASAPFYGPGQAFVSLHAAQADTVAVVRFVPNEDALEPNDEAAMAAPIELGKWTRASLALGDEDWFELDLKSDSDVTVSILGLNDGERPEIVLQDPSAAAAYPYRLKAGKTKVALRPGNLARFDTFLVRFDARKPKKGLTSGRPVTVTASAYPAAYTFPLKLDGPTRVDLNFTGLPVGTSVGWTVASDKASFNGSPRVPVYLEPGEYTLTVALPATSKPCAVRLTPSFVRVQNEPNNSQEQAADLDLPSTFSAHFGFAGDSDWYKLTVSEKGLLRLRQPDGADHSALDINVQLYAKGVGQGVGGFPIRTDRLDMNFPVEKGEYFLCLTRGTVQRNPEPLEVALSKPSEIKESTEGGVGIALVGFGVKAGDGNWMESLARESAIEFISADESKDLGADLAASLERKEEMIGGGFSWTKALLIGLGTLVVLWLGKALLARRLRTEPKP
jgi:hypothetical protein